LTKKRSRIIALIFTIILTIIFYISISKTSGKNADSQNLGEIGVIVVNGDIPPYTEITDELISEKKMVLSKDVKGYFTKKKDVIGKVSTSHLYSGEIVTSNRLASKEDSVLGLATRIEEGKRAVTVAVDIEQGISGNIKIGNYVDIIFVGEAYGESASRYFDSVSGKGKPLNTQVLYPSLGDFFSTTVLQNIKVISLDRVFYETKGNSEIGYQSVTLEVTPEEATKIALLPAEGGIRLSLRSPGDDGISSYPRDTIIKDTNIHGHTEENAEE